MAKKVSRPGPGTRSGGEPGDVEAFLGSLDHPFKKEIRALRQIILGADPRIREGIKWNAPSFRTSEDFATFHLRSKEGVQVILHRGVKKRDDPAFRGAIEDPVGLLDWLAADRASAKFRALDDIESKRSAFAKIIRRWIEHV